MAAESKRTPEREQAVLSRMANGETLTDICKDIGIHPATWRVWCREDKALDIAHAHARDDGYDAIANNIRLTARGKGDSTADVQRDKLIVDTDLKLLAKWDPKRYGDKVEVEHSGSIDMDPEARIARIAELTAKLHGAE